MMGGAEQYVSARSMLVLFYTKGEVIMITEIIPCSSLQQLPENFALRW